MVKMVERPTEVLENVMLPALSHTELLLVVVLDGDFFEAHTDLVLIERDTLTAHRYKTDILQHHNMISYYAGFIGNGFLLMQHNARSHTVRISVAT